MVTLKILLGICLALVVGKGADALPNGCRGGWTLVGESCLWASMGQASYEDATRVCVDNWGAVMATPHNEAENHQFASYMWSKKSTLWLGCDDLKQEGEFVCQDGHDLASFNKWSNNQPDNGEFTYDKPEQNCMRMQHNEKWGDSACKNKRHYLCSLPPRV